MSEKDDLHIAILKYGKDRLEKGITFRELYDYIKEKGYEVSEYTIKSCMGSSYETLEQKYRPLGFSDFGKKEIKFTLTIESTFRLIEYEEFKSANKNALSATRFATSAIFVSIVALVISIYYSSKQLSTATKINDEQLDKIIQLKYDDSSANKKLEEIIKNQKLLIDNQKENIKAILRKNITPNQSNTTNSKN